MTANTSINLVRGRRPRVLDQVVSWTLTIGRAVVILTEVIALGAFIYRFSLDRQLIALHDKIAQEESIVNLLQKNENSYRNLQNRLSLASTIIDSEQQSITNYQSIMATIPPGVFLKSLIIDPQLIKINVDTPTTAAVSALISNLKNYPAITNVSVDKIENKTSVGLIGVNLSLTVKSKAKQL